MFMATNSQYQSFAELTLGLLIIYISIYQSLTFNNRMLNKW